MFKTILVPAAGDSADAPAFAAALAMARRYAAHIDALHVRLDPATVAMAMAGDSGSGAMTAGLIDRLEQEGREREAKARANFDRFCGAAGLPLAEAPGGAQPSAQWHAETGEEPRWIAAYGLASDLIVIGRGAAEEGISRNSLEAALLETGRPLLIPAGAMPAACDRVAIAWKPTPQAARAVTMAMPLLAQAREVTVLAVEERGTLPDSAERLGRGLAWHGLAVRTEHLTAAREGAAATLLAAARARADLLVMGGYGHSRVREWVFGGFTETVLRDAPLPVLIAH